MLKEHKELIILSDIYYKTRIKKHKTFSFLIFNNLRLKTRTLDFLTDRNERLKLHTFLVLKNEGL